METRVEQEIRGEEEWKNVIMWFENARLWSGWNQVMRQVHNIDQGHWRLPMRGSKREEGEIRQDL